MGNHLELFHWHEKSQDFILDVSKGIFLLPVQEGTIMSVFADSECQLKEKVQDLSVSCEEENLKSTTWLSSLSVWSDTSVCIWLSPKTTGFWVLSGPNVKFRLPTMVLETDQGASCSTGQVLLNCCKWKYYGGESVPSHIPLLKLYLFLWLIDWLINMIFKTQLSRTPVGYCSHRWSCLTSTWTSSLSTETVLTWPGISVLIHELFCVPNNLLKRLSSWITTVYVILCFCSACSLAQSGSLIR